jgi:PKD repeat protein
MMHIIKNVFLPFFMLLTTLSFSQCVDFTLNSSACLNEVLEIESLATGSFYQWDFCEGDLMGVPEISKLTTFSGFNDVRGLDVVFDGSKWYGFFTDKTQNSLIRIDFGSSLTDSIPISTELGNIGGLLNGPEPIKILKEANEWYGIVHNKGDLSLIKLHFGSSLTNMPTASLILAGVGSDGTNLDYSYTNDSLVVILSNFSSANFTTVNLGSSINNIPAINDYFSFSGLSFPSDISLINQCDKWYGISIEFFSLKAYLLNFGSSLFSTPTITEIGTSIFSTNPRRTQILKDQNDYIVFSVSTTGKVHRINLGPDLENIVPVYTDLGINGGMNRSESLAIVKEGSSWSGFSMDRLFGNFYQMVFPNVCSSSQEISSEKNPIGTYYTSEGTYNVGLKIFDEQMNLIGETSKSILVGSSSAPQISLLNENICVVSDITFNGINNSIDGQVITSWTWDFGDASIVETGQNVVHQYVSTGEYEVRLNAVSNNGCNQLIYNTITIYDEPVPDFTIPTGTICTNQQASFINTTPGSYGGFISWEWQIDGLVVSTDQDLAAMFDTGGNKEVKLIATIPGCIVEMAKLLTNVKEGVLPVYSFDDNCAGQIVQFNNNSVGVVNDIAWDFGNGFTSSLENPALEFANDGTYDVTLTLTNSDGCITSTSTPITIHPLPIVNYSNELACENLATQFTDLSSITLDNLASWSWQFDDASTPSTDQNPQHIFNNFGSYNVKLTTTTTFGCVDSLVQVVEVLAAPIVDFSLDKACIDVPIQFTDQSTPVTGEGITEWSWNLGGTFSSIQNPTHIFSNALDHTVGLTVTSQNLCTSSQTKNITIPPAPTVQFELNDDCANEVATLSDNTKINGDNISQWLWKLDTQTIGIEAAIDYKFLKADNYNISLSIETENGCAYDGQQTITVHPVPTASFNTSFSFGAPPFAVAFTNESVEANEYSWFFEENELSTDVNPNHTFNNLGNFDVQLVAINDKNCRDTTFQRINVLEPILDIELLNFTIIPSANADLLSLTLRNNGTIRLDSLEVIINLGGELDVQEVINYPLNPEETITAQLALRVNNRRLEYICASVASFLNNIDDASPKNNNKCITFNSNQAIVTAPYPNPVKENLILEIVSTKNVDVSVDIISTTGALASTFKAPLSEGNNKLTLDLGALNSGIYIVKITVQDQVKTYRIMINK